MFRLSLGRLRTPPLAATILLVVIGRVYTARAQDEGVPVVPKDSPLIQTAKQQMIFDELRHERAERREAARGARKRATVRHGRKGAKAGEARDEDIAAGRLVTGARGGRGATPLGVKGTAVVPTNVELNDKTGDGVTAGQAEERHRLAVVVDRDEELAEEERDDREVVADEPPRGQGDEEAEADGRERDQRQDHPGRPVQPELRRGEHRVAVGAEAEEGRVAEVEQAGEADDDVEPEREQHVDKRVEADAEHVAVVGHERQHRGDDDERQEPGRSGNALRRVSH